ncbi:MAG TPA: PEP-CTERM sorting domain-containing protein [Burkholderiaceae bacterium]|nr:PEP-CTERM sorting domain-containing protein [Burkholderiaceae bacterium]
MITRPLTPLMLMLMLMLAAVVPPVAAAEPLAPGGVIYASPGTTLAAEPLLAGTVVEDVVTPFSYSGWLQNLGLGPSPRTFIGQVHGSVRSRVVLNNDNTYDFYWRVTVDRDSFLPVSHFFVEGFAPGKYNANWRIDGEGDVPPALIGQRDNGDLYWSFGAFAPESRQIAPESGSYFLFIDTDARTYSRTASFSVLSGRNESGSMLVTWGGASDSYVTFAPSPVPEPSSTLLALIGLGCLGLCTKAVTLRKRKA